MAPKSRLSEAAISKPPTDLAPSVVISDLASLTGTYPIRVGANSVIHPRAKFNSSQGPITIGELCIISERALIAPPDTEGVVIESGVLVEINAVVEARRIGEGTMVEVGVKIGKGAVVGKNCKFTPLNKIADGEVVPDSTVVYGIGQRRIDASGSAEARRRLTERHVEALRALIPSNRNKFLS